MHLCSEYLELQHSLLLTGHAKPNPSRPETTSSSLVCISLQFMQDASSSSLFCWQTLFFLFLSFCGFFMQAMIQSPGFPEDYLFFEDSPIINCTPFSFLNLTRCLWQCLCLLTCTCLDNMMFSSPFVHSNRANLKSRCLIRCNIFRRWWHVRALIPLSFVSFFFSFSFCIWHPKC